jgi:DnaJ-class molecular chaperone
MGDGTTSILSAMGRDLRSKNNPVVDCNRCFGGGKLFLPSLHDWKTYELKSCPKCQGSGEMVREWR